MYSDYFESFENFLLKFIKEKNIQTAVEIGSDPQLILASHLARTTKKTYAVNCSDDHQRLQPSYELHREMGGITNLELKAGNAAHLSTLIPHADLIVLQNVLLDGNDGNDTTLMWKYRNKQIPFNQTALEELRDRFINTEKQAYQEFLRVAQPGYIIRFGIPDLQFPQLLSELKISPSQIKQERFSYDFGTVWEAYIIDNIPK